MSAEATAIYGIVAAVISVPSIVGGVNFVKYLQNDNAETRKKLPEACLA